MVEKNYDPDNDNCPEKDTVENLHKSKGNSNNTQNVEEFIDDSPNRLSADKVKDLKQKSDTKE
ncbi:MAG: hypothetical protein ABIP27_16415 [Flavobacterium circumlabens]|uniref:hypothetical protein n=1 Tax=Flavobacterium circumlabens TaxID=2133765 RepID=UPI0032630824